MTIFDTFTIERTYNASLREVWEAWTDPKLRPQWFHGPPNWDELARELDFRVGGGELLAGRMPNGTETKFVARFHVIEPELRIVYDYDMWVGGKLMSVSLATLDLSGATNLRYTEQGAYFLGNPEDPPGRKRGTSWHYDNLDELLKKK